MSEIIKYFFNGIELVTRNVPGDQFPFILYFNIDSTNITLSLAEVLSTAVLGVTRTPPWEEIIKLPSEFDEIMDIILGSVLFLEDIDEKILAVSLADHFFTMLSSYWEDLIQNRRSKNLALAFLEAIIEKVMTWEESKGRRVHKGSPFYFLTSIYSAMGDLDSAFASTFKAIEEDRLSKGNALNDPNIYVNSPAYRYVSLEDNTANYLYEAIIKSRNYLDNHITELKSNPTILNLSHLNLNVLDTNFFNNRQFEEIRHLFVYCLEKIIKYEEQFSHLKINNEFYKIKNANDIFTLCLIIEKILEKKYRSSISGRVTMAPLVLEYLSRKGLISGFSDAGALSRALTPPVLSRKPNQYVPDLLDGNTSINSTTLSTEEVSMILIWGLRNWGAHRIKSQDIFVTRYSDIIRTVLWAFILAIEA